MICRAITPSHIHRAPRKVWYVQDRRPQINLGRDEDGGPPSLSRADCDGGTRSRPPPKPRSDLVVAVIASFSRGFAGGKLKR